MEVPGPGEFAKASRPLEATIKLCPTVVLTNSLPYHMEGYVVTAAVPGTRDDDRAPALSTQASAAVPSSARPTHMPYMAAAAAPVAAAGVPGAEALTLGQPTPAGTPPAAARPGSSMSSAPRGLGRLRRSEATSLNDVSEEERSNTVAQLQLLVSQLRGKVCTLCGYWPPAM